MAENTREAQFNELQQRFASLDYQRLDADADARITRWRYAEQSVFELRADYFRRFNANLGKLLDDEPVNAFMFYAYGYDAQDRIIYAARFQTEEMPRICTFFDYGDGHIDLAAYNITLHTDRYHLQKVGRLAQPQKPLHYAEYVQAVGQGRHLFEAYHYDERGRIARISSFHSTHPRPLGEEAQRRWQDAMEQQRTMAPMLGTEDLLEKMMPQFDEALSHIQRPSSSESEESYEYEGETLMRIVSGDNADIIFEAPRAGETDESLFEAARASLRTTIMEHLLEFDKRQQMRVYNLVLSYDAVADDGLLLVFGQESHRAAWERETDDHSYASLVFHNLAVPPEAIEIWELPGDYARFLRDYRRNARWDDIRSLFVRIARDLNESDLTGILNTTDDFIVFPNDYEAMQSPEAEILACVPEDRLRILRVRGLLR